MALNGGCHCGAVHYEVSGEPLHCSVCHCSDCRRSAGAPMVSWAAFPADRFRVVKGEARMRKSSGAAFRYFCGDCGTGLYYVNEDMLPGLVDIQTATLDDPDALQPQLHVQTAEQLAWVPGMAHLPAFARFPSED